MDKQAAPEPLRAFVVAFKLKNKEKLMRMRDEVVQCAEAESDKQLLLKLFDPEGDSLCCDLAMQIHSGAKVSDDLLGFHTDSSNSLFHLALTIHGGRKLHSRVSQTKKEGFMNRDMPAFVQTLKAGDIYVSNPACFQHAVEFYETKW